MHTVNKEGHAAVAYLGALVALHELRKGGSQARSRF